MMGAAVYGEIKGTWKEMIVAHFGSLLNPLLYESRKSDVVYLTISKVVIIHEVLYVQRLLWSSG
jgi:hypothetical protein